MPKAFDYVKKTKKTLAVIFIIWLALIFIAPLTLPSGSVDDLDGKIGNMDNTDVISEMNPLAAVMYALGDINCHQMTSNSFYLNGNEMPFCVRDTGIFIGLAIGSLISLFFAPKFRWTALIILILPILIDGGAQMVSDYVSFNELRLVTGILCGIGVTYFLGYLAENSVKRVREKARKS